MPIFWGEHCVCSCVHPKRPASRLQNGLRDAIEVRVDNPNPDIVQDVKAVGQKLGRAQGDELSRSEYLQHGRFSGYWLYDGGQTWDNYCRAAGYVTRKVEPVSDDVYLSRLVKAVKILGRFPKTSERKKFGLNFTRRRFPTLKSFIDYTATLGILPNGPHKPPLPTEPAKSAVGPAPEPDKPSAALSAAAVAPIPAHTRRKNWERTEIGGFPYAPQDELGVVALFGILCAQGKIDWQIVELRGGKGIDATCYDNKTGQHITVELKKTLRRASWNHSIDDIDYLVCWENRWPEFPKPVIALRDLVKPKKS